jgi:hypothetical protein
MTIDDLPQDTASPPPRYSLAKALWKEVSENPLRCLLAFLQTALLITAGAIYSSAWIWPEPSFVAVPEMILFKQTDGKFVGRVSFSHVSGSNVVYVAANVARYADIKNEGIPELEMSHSETYAVHDGGPLPPMRITFRSIPEHFDLCLSVLNVDKVFTHFQLKFVAEDLVSTTDSTQQSIRYAVHSGFRDLQGRCFTQYRTEGRELVLPEDEAKRQRWR